jgi:hypothetical protein
VNYVTPRRPTTNELFGSQHGIPAYAMLDVWMALGGTFESFDRMWGEDGRTPADTWAQLMCVVRRDFQTLAKDTNPPMGPEFEALCPSIPQPGAA